MSAIKTLQQNAQTKQQKVVDLSIRHILAKSLTDSGRFNAIHIKMDSRRGSLSLKVFGTRDSRSTDYVEATAARNGLKISLRLTTAAWDHSIFQVEELRMANSAQVASAPVATLADSMSKTLSTAGGSIAVYVAGVSLGYVSDKAAAQIRALVAADQRPKTQDVKMIDLVANKPVVVSFPYAVAEAIKAKVPSYVGHNFTVKSTSGVVIVRNQADGATGHWVMA